jgi:hypothetical protein
MFADGANCVWLLAIPHQSLGGGSMYAFHLPATIPPPGSPGGPRLPAAYKYMAGSPFDWREMIYRNIRDPQEMQATLDNMQRTFTEAQKRARNKK